MELVFKFKKLKREPGFVYYVKSDAEGFLELWKTENRKGRPFGVTGAYRDEQGNPISVYEWRKKFPEKFHEQQKELRLRTRLEKIKMELEKYKK